jgi:HSP20 family protein
MTNVNIKSGPARQNQNNPTGKPYYYISDLVHLHLTLHPNLWRPPTDVFETEDKIVVRVEIAGMHESDFSVNFDQGILQITGLRPEAPEKRAFHQMEIHFGEFLTEVEILIPIDLEKIDAVYQDGFLRVGLPKALPKQIKITQE